MLRLMAMTIMVVMVMMIMMVMVMLKIIVMVMRIGHLAINSKLMVHTLEPPKNGSNYKGFNMFVFRRNIPLLNKS